MKFRYALMALVAAVVSLTSLDASAAGRRQLKPVPRDPNAPPVFVLGVGEAVPIDTADRTLSSRMTAAASAKVTALRKAPTRRSVAALASTSSVVCGASTSLPAEITTLAAGLKCDPDLIFEYVRNTIEYEPLFGSNKGALGTLLDQRGDDFDQAQLLAALLSAAGYGSSSVNFQYGYLRLTGAQATAWLGVSNDATAIGNLFANGGIPTANISATGTTLNSIDVAHVWLQVTIGGTAYAFDPSFKPHTVVAGVGGLASIMGYTQSAFLADAGGTIDPSDNSIRSVNRAAARADLTTYANKLLAYIHANNPAWTVNDVVGGKTIQPVTGSPLRNTTVPNLSPSQPSGFPQTWSTIPNSYRTCLSISMPGVTSTPCTAPSTSTIALYADETYGHRITIFSVASGSNYVPTLLIDGAAPPNGTNTGPATAGGANWAVSVAITHPYASSALAGANQSGVLNMAAAGNYLVNVGWGQVGRGMVEKHRTLLAQARARGLASDSETVLGESLAIVGYTWQAENAAGVRLRDNVGVATSQLHHALGITAQGLIQGQSSTIGPYVDTPFNYLSIQPQTAYTGACVSPTVLGSFFGTWGTASAMESAVLEQTQALSSGMIAASTTRLIDTNAATGARTYFAAGTTSAGLTQYFSVIRPAISGTYSASDLAIIDNAISTTGGSGGSPTGKQVVLPAAGNQAVGFWSGAGYGVTGQSCSAGMPYTLSATNWITGALNGGATGANVPTIGSPGTPVISSNSQTLTTPPSADALIPGGAIATAHAVGNPLAGNPVDGIGGAYVYSHDDLTTGGGGAPYAMTFARTYSSASATSDGGLGNGWSHNFSLGASRTTDPYVGLGDRAPIPTAPTGSALAGSGESSALAAVQAIVATYVSQDLMSGTQSAQNMTVAAVSERWLTDQLTNNAVMVTAPTSSGEFTWLPHADGATTIAYLPPPGGAGNLVGTLPDGAGTPTLFTFTGKDQSKTYFSQIGSTGDGKIAATVQPYGMITAFTYGYTYNGSSYLTGVANSLGRGFSLSYSSGHVTSVTDDTGRSVSYAYASTSDMASATDVLGAITNFSYDRSGAYDSNGHLTQVYYPSRPSTPFVTNWYDALGRVSQQADAAGNRITFWVAGTRTEIANPAGARQVSYQTPRGARTMQAAVLSGSANVFNDTVQNNGVTNVATVQYDGADRTVLSTAPEGGTTGYTYSPDLMQNVLTTTATPKPGSGLSPLVTTYAYDAVFNKPVQVTDPRGLVATMTYDPVTGMLLKSVSDAGNASHYNVTSRITYDAVGHVKTTTDASGVTSAFAYDAKGNLTTIIGDWGGQNITATATYDNLGNVLTSTDPRGAVTSMAYDAARRLSSVSLPLAAANAAPIVTKFTYDLDGELLTTTQLSGGTVLRTVASTYTPTGNVSTATDANGNTTRYGYDNVDRLSQVTDPLGTTTTAAYDALSRVTASYNPAIQANPLASTAYTPDGLTASVSIARSNSVTDTTAYAYDGLNRTGTVTYADATTNTYTYDADSNVLTAKTRAGATITYSYDTLNRLVTKTPPSAPVVTYAYDQSSRQTGVSDSSASIVSPSASASFGQSTTYDVLNRPIANTWSGAPAQTAPASSSSVTYAHGYDANNRRISQAVNDNAWLGYPTGGASSTAYTANSLNQYTAVGSVTPTYDGNGALTYDGQFTYAYDVESKLASIKIGASTVATYGYDAQGRRRSKTVGSAKTVYVTDPANDGVLDYDGTTGNILHWYPAGSVVDVPGGTRQTMIGDIQGSVVATLASSGTLTKYGYLPFGENPSLTADGQRYTGQQFDAETAGSTAQPSGLYYLRARTYSPTWGRFLQADPVGFGGGHNFYAYAGGDPLNNSDPSGLSFSGCEQDDTYIVVCGRYTPPIIPFNPGEITGGLVSPGPGGFGDPGGGDGGSGPGPSDAPGPSAPAPAQDPSPPPECTEAGPNCVAVRHPTENKAETDPVVVNGSKYQAPVAAPPPATLVQAAFQMAGLSSPQTPTISCSSKLPDGSTVGDKVRQLYNMINQADNEGNILSGAGTFFQGVATGGILDFKNTFSGAARNGYSGSYLAAAGNFAYGAAASNYFGNSAVGNQIAYAGGFGYALSHGKANVTPPGTIFPQDASGAANIPAGLKSGGCF